MRKDNYQAMLLAVIQPVACSASANNALQLIGFHPDNLVDSFVAPELKALSPKFHGSEKMGVIRG